MNYGILVDVTRCTGCESCVTACIATNKLDSAKAEVDRMTGRDGLSANRWLSIQKVAEGRFARKSCMHCEEPSCVSACLVGGLTKTDEGPVVYDPEKCIGCRYCMLACPFHIPRYEWSETTPFMRKCSLCYTQYLDGKQPACVEVCPHQALTFGGRDDLIALAHERIRTQPGLYQHHIWGETELGGTSLLYISDVDLSALDWPSADSPPIPHLTEPLISSTPFIGLSVASGILGINWVVKRRMKLAAEQSEVKPVSSSQTTPPESEDARDD